MTEVNIYTWGQNPCSTICVFFQLGFPGVNLIERLSTLHNYLFIIEYRWSFAFTAEKEDHKTHQGIVRSL